MSSRTAISPVKPAVEAKNPGVEIQDSDYSSVGYIRCLDYPMLLATVGLLTCSLLVLSGATKDDVPGDPSFYLKRQAIYAVVGMALLLFISRLDYSRLRPYKHLIYSGAIASILLVLAVGGATRGSRRWIELPFFRFQPSELGKLLLIVVLAAVVVDRSRALKFKGMTSRILAVTFLPAGLVLAQPDLGTGLVYVTIGIAVLFLAGAPWHHLAGVGALFCAAAVLALLVAPAVGIQVLKPYQVERLTAFLHPSANPADEGYQQEQSQIAIGSGEKTGRGFDNATQTRLDFLPEHHTDFIFAVVGETYGFAGAGLVLALYALFVWRCLRLLAVAKNLFGTLIVGGVVAMLVFQVFVNVGMTIGIMPITGVPLPLMSYGGSSVIVTLLSIGLLQSVHVQARLAAAGRGRLKVT